MSKKKMSANATGRDIIDEVVTENASRNQKVFDDAVNYPPYFGSVNIGETKTQLTPIKNRTKLGKQPLISDIIEGTKNFKLDAGTAKVSLVEAGVVDKSIEVNPTIIKLIKTCVACSYSPNEDYSIVVTAFIHSLIGMLENINLPISLPADNKTQKIIGKELNDFLQSICDKEGIKYFEVLDTPKKKRGKSKLLEAADKAVVQ